MADKQNAKRLGDEARRECKTKFVIFVMGKDGAGKSTLIRHCTELDRHVRDSKTIWAKKPYGIIRFAEVPGFLQVPPTDKQILEDLESFLKTIEQSKPNGIPEYKLSGLVFVQKIRNGVPQDDENLKNLKVMSWIAWKADRDLLTGVLNSNGAGQGLVTFRKEWRKHVSGIFHHPTVKDISLNTNSDISKNSVKDLLREMFESGRKRMLTLDPRYAIKKLPVN